MSPLRYIPELNCSFYTRLFPADGSACRGPEATAAMSADELEVQRSWATAIEQHFGDLEAMLIRFGGCTLIALSGSCFLVMSLMLSLLIFFLLVLKFNCLKGECMDRSDVQFKMLCKGVSKLVLGAKAEFDKVVADLRSTSFPFLVNISKAARNTLLELTEMASKQLGSELGLQSLTPAISRSGLVPKSIPQQPFLVVVAPRAVDLAESPMSTSIDQDAPSISIPSTQEQEHSPIISQGFEESPKTPHFHDDPLHESLHEESTSQGSSSNVRPIYTLFESLGRWTKDHPIANVIGDPSRFCLHRKQTTDDAMWCYF
ncbi:hypothetical protein Tco_0728636 [Tanacetum coccineum]|uniref:Uncharacterized protein n=1 Tax=Tanacetum coccineum TaxID=301880 RepID=A0ABQ4YMK0_9ASTR